MEGTPNRLPASPNETKDTAAGHIRADLIAGTLRRVREKWRRVLPLKSPRPLFRVSSGSGPGGWQQRSQRSLSFVLLCVWALTRGQSDQSYANGNQMGRESPVASRRRREACVFMYVCAAGARRSGLAPLLYSDRSAPSPRSFARSLDKRCRLQTRMRRNQPNAVLLLPGKPKVSKRASAPFLLPVDRFEGLVQIRRSDPIEQVIGHMYP